MSTKDEKDGDIFMKDAEETDCTAQQAQNSGERKEEDQLGSNQGEDRDAEELGFKFEPSSDDDDDDDDDNGNDKEGSMSPEGPNSPSSRLETANTSLTGFIPLSFSRWPLSLSFQFYFSASIV